MDALLVAEVSLLIVHAELLYPSFFRALLLTTRDVCQFLLMDVLSPVGKGREDVLVRVEWRQV